VFPGCGPAFDHDDVNVDANVAALVTGTGPSAGNFSAAVTHEEEVVVFPTGRWEYHFTVTWTGANYTGLAPATYSITCNN
jgi:hypothetical protein